VALALGLVIGSACGDDVLPPPALTGGGSPDTSSGTVSTGSTGESDGPAEADGTSGSSGSSEPGTEGATTGETGSSSDDASDRGSDTQGSTSSSDTSTSDTGTSDTSTSDTSTSSESTDTAGASTGSTGSSGETGSSSDTGSGSGSGDTGEETICVDVDLGGALGLTLGDTTALGDDLDPPCVPGLGGRDAGHRFVAPADGFYAFDTAGSSFDTVLHAYAPDCSGTLRGCNDDDALGVLQARLPLYLAAQEEAVVVVDGWDDTQLGAYTLDVSAVFESCVDEDLGQVLNATIMGTTTGELDKLEPSCLPSSGPDYVVRWVAPSNDVYRIRTSGSSFDTVLYVLPGECAGAPIACNDDATPVDLTSTVLVSPGFGEVVTIVVVGFDAGEHGPFTLIVEPQ
jgi:hypothetical protein